MKNKRHEDRIPLLTPNNQKFLLDFLETLEDDENQKRQYRSQLILFLESKITHDVTEFDEDDLEKYFITKNNDTPISYVKSFLNFVSARSPLKINDIDILDVLRKNKEVNKVIPLTIDEIIKIRKVIQSNFNHLFIFEMAYRHGLTRELIGACSKDNYSDGAFILRGKTITLDESFKVIVDNYIDSLKKRDVSGIIHYFKRIEDDFQRRYSNNRSITWEVVNQTRKQHFFRCQRCGELYENSSYNWVLIQYDDDPFDTKFMVCKTCGAKGMQVNG